MRYDITEFERGWMDWFRKSEPFFPVLPERPRMFSDRLLRPDAFPRFRLFRWLP